MDDGQQSTLADQAATWVPPWARRPAAPTIEPPAQPAEPAPAIEAALGEAALVEVAPVEAAPVEDGEAGEDGEVWQLPERRLRGALEAILLVVDEPVSELLLAQVLEQPAA